MNAKPRAYYNENDPRAAAWLQALITAGVIADGDVDTRSVVDVQPADLGGYAQCHFFAGIGGWSYALRLAGWADAREVWTGSCPCQPFSAAGRQAGTQDSRHLWPDWARLIRECRPPVVFGEQVDAALAHGWLDLVYDDLEGEGYAVGAAGLPACSVGAPHIRQRLWFVADRDGARRGEGGTGEAGDGGDTPREQPAGLCDAGIVADSLCAASERRTGGVSGAQAAGGGAREFDGDRVDRSANGGEAGELGHADHTGLQGWQRVSERARKCAAGAAGLAGVWAACEWIPCRDGKWRPVEPGTFPLAYGVPARMGRLRGYGNAIVPEVAAEFIDAYLRVAG